MYINIILLVLCWWQFEFGFQKWVYYLKIKTSMEIYLEIEEKIKIKKTQRNHGVSLK